MASVKDMPRLHTRHVCFAYSTNRTISGTMVQMGIANLPIPLRALTEQEREFVIHYCQHGNVDDAKRKARYQDTASGHYLLRRPAIALAVRAEITRLMATEGAQVGYKALRAIAEADKAPAAARVAAAKALLQGAGLLEAPQESKESKSINDMTQAELLAYIDKRKADIDQMESELASRARDITPDSDSQVPDIFE